MVLSDKDIELLKFKEHDVVVKKVNLSTGEYYAKYCTVHDAFMELLGKRVFELVGIKCPKYTYISDAHCVLSDDIKKYDMYYNPFDLEMNGYTLKDIKDKLYACEKFSNLEQIYFQIDIMHFIDILFSNIDRHISNFGFSLKEDGTGYLIVYDNADFLQEFEKATRPMSIEGSNCLDFVFTSKKDEAREFILSLSEEKRMYMLKIYELFSPMRLLTIVRNIEKENNFKLPNKFNIFKYYVMNYYMLGKLLKDNNKLKNK